MPSAAPLLAVAAALALCGIAHAQPSILLRRCPENVQLVIAQASNGSAPFPARTSVAVCHDDTMLQLAYTSLDDPLLLNDRTKCNSDLYNQEVVEVFVSEGSAAPEHYLEVELSPRNLLYVSQIKNPYRNGSDLSHRLVGCEQSGVRHLVHAGGNSWNGTLSIPLSLIHAASQPWTNTSALAPRVGVADVYRINFFRVLALDKVESCTADTCAYGAWGPTFRYPPAFHVPTAMGYAKVV